MTGLAQRLGNALEVAVVILVDHYIAAWAVALALLAGIVLPDMPLLRHTYISFLFILVVLLWVKVRGEKWAGFGLIPLRARYLAFGLLLAVADVVLDSVVRSISTPLIVSWTGADPHLDAKAFAALTGNLPLLMMIVPVVWLFAAFGEEFLFRGYLLTRLGQVFGASSAAWGLAIVGQAAVFAFGHAYQGPVGMFPIFIGGILSGVVSVIWGRNLWPVMVAHGLVDTLGFTVLYLGMPTS